MPKTTAAKIQQALQKANISSVYLLTGEDLFRKKELIDQIKAAVHPDDFNIYSSEWYSLTSFCTNFLIALA